MDPDRVKGVRPVEEASEARMVERQIALDNALACPRPDGAALHPRDDAQHALDVARLWSTRDSLGPQALTDAVNGDTPGPHEDVDDRSVREKSHDVGSER